jgi:hypothetical protein
MQVITDAYRILIEKKNLAKSVQLENREERHRKSEDTRERIDIRGCIQKFPDWLPGARTANGIVLCH